MTGKCIIFSAPSGAGKTTIVKNLLSRGLNMEFSISATSRKPRPGEVDGKDYYFLSPERFQVKIENEQLVEWEEVYSGTYYGTLKSELERIWSNGNHVLFDVDVKGGLNLKKIFGKMHCRYSFNHLRSRSSKIGYVIVVPKTKSRFVNVSEKQPKS